MITLSYNQNIQIRALMAYYNNSVKLFLSESIIQDVKFTDRQDVEDWFKDLRQFDFRSDELIDFILDNKVADAHDFLMILVKGLGLKRRKPPITDEQRARFKIAWKATEERYRNLHNTNITSYN